jgi:hypothetical protein
MSINLNQKALLIALLCLNLCSCNSIIEKDSVDSIIEDNAIPLPSNPQLLDDYCSRIDTNLSIQAIQKSDFNDPIIPVLTQEERIKKLGVKTEKRIFDTGHWLDHYDRDGNHVKWVVSIKGEAPELSETSTRYVYDTNRRVTHEKYDDGTEDGLKANYEYFYEANGDRIIREVRTFKRKGEENSITEDLHHYSGGYLLPISSEHYIDGDLYQRIYYDTIKKVNSQYDILNVRKDFYNSQDLNVLEIFYFDEKYIGCIMREYNKNGWQKKEMTSFENYTGIIHYAYDSMGNLIRMTDSTDYNRNGEFLINVCTYSYSENRLMSESTSTFAGKETYTSLYEYTFYK